MHQNKQEIRTIPPKIKKKKREKIKPDDTSYQIEDSWNEASLIKWHR